MRIVIRVVVAGLLLCSATSCVARSGPDYLPVSSQPPTRSDIAGECATTDIVVTGGIDDEPKVTLPDEGTCIAPTTLLVRDLVRGEGPQAVTGSDLEVNYSMVTWSNGEVLDSTWYAGESLTVPADNLGQAELVKGWSEGLPGIREGGRRLLVVPPDLGRRGADGSTGDETLVYVVDAVKVTTR